MAASSPALAATVTTPVPPPLPLPLPLPLPPPPPPPLLALLPQLAAATATSMQRSDPPKTLRGLNKPKCIKCGNVARSRCPYQSCKSCCAKAQNPCHIHVLKANATFSDKTPSSSSPLFDQQSTEVSPSGTSHRVASFRHLSSTFAQFNNVQIPLRSRKPLTRKDAAAINEWRFSKLKEYRDRNIEAENEAFDRYMQKITLLEDVFSAESTLEGSTGNGPPISDMNPTSVENNTGIIISGLKVNLRSNPVRNYNSRNRLRVIVDRGLRKLQKCEVDNASTEPDDQNELIKKPKIDKTWRDERASALSDLIDKLNKSRNVEDLKSCLEMKSQIFNRHPKISQADTEHVEISKEQQTAALRRESEISLTKLFSTAEIDQETLDRIDAHFSSLGQIEDL
ncbi:hypothetical protein L1049_027169 [Liquidambar formosana]|uniref:Uncharacterized protein n=1 Tax=Liquidambar formosana TaxID=63359 RepID=A0AAP0R398_LIQFO